MTAPLTVAFLLLSLTPAGEPRRIAVRVAESAPGRADLERLAGWGRRAGISIEVAPESVPVPAGSEAIRVSGLPISDSLARSLTRFPVRFERAGFLFGGRAFRGPEDGILLSDPARPEETFVVGNGGRAILGLLRHAVWRESRTGDYLVVSGSLTKEGRFLRGKSPLALDPASGKDEIAAREGFFRSLETLDRDGVRWRFRESERPGIARWEPVLRKLGPKGCSGALTVRLFPDPSTKARYTGSSRPADIAVEGDSVRVDLDVSAPDSPDLVSPVLASAAAVVRDARLSARPLLLAAVGARACGRWWGREVSEFGAFARQARVEPSAEEVARSQEDVSPVLAVGAAAAWLEAGARSEGEGAVARALAGGEAELVSALKRWADRAVAVRVSTPPRRALPAGFLRGISYAMSNSIDGSYASPRSRETLQRLAKMSVNSVSIMPFAFAPEPHRPSLTFVHRHPAGETDEGTVRAVSDARALGISSLIKPQIWLPGAFVGELSMREEADWSRWFDVYRRFVVHQALVAEASGASIFCVGTELVGTEPRARDWRDTIAAVRLATGAPLVYASNWAAGAPKVPFWDSLDAIGVDFYDSLSADPAASDAQLAAGVRAAVAPLVPLARRTGKPVLFAEAGYPPVQAAWITPHDENSKRPPGRADAARAIAVVFRALEKEPWWRGVYWWKAFSDGRPAHGDDRDYNVIGTPAEQAIAEGFERLARER